MGQHCGVCYELVQALDVPVLQMVEQHVEVLSFLRSSLPAVPEHVIEVPILSLPVCAVLRAVLLEPQMVEQLVEVPTPFYIFEQNADIPVPRGVVLVLVFKVFPQNRVQQRLSRSRSLTFLSTVEAFVAFSQDRVQQRRLRRSLTFLPVEVLTVFSPDRVPQRLPLRMLNFRLVEVFTFYAQDRVFRRFLDLNTAMMLLAVHAEVEDLLEVLKALSQDRAQQSEVELGIAGLLDASSYRHVQKGVASSTPMRWPSSVVLRLVAFGCLSRGRGSSPETRP